MSDQPAEPEDDVPGLEDILRASQGIGPDFLAMAGQLASIHAEWRKAWENTGAFDHTESFELVRILVASSAGGIKFLGLSLLPEGRTSHRRPVSSPFNTIPGRSASTGHGAFSLR